MKDKNHMIIAVDAEKAFEKIQHLFIIKHFQQSGYRGNIPQHKKCIYDISTTNVIFNNEKLQAFALRSGTRQGCLL